MTHDDRNNSSGNQSADGRVADNGGSDNGSGDHRGLPEANVKKRYIGAVWLVPMIALLIAGYLGVRSFAERGPEITITFQSGDGLNAGQTPVKYKAVTIGIVQDIGLSKDRNGVVVHVRMNAEAEPMLTDDAQFWVVRPRLNTPSLSSLETLVSGTYIQIEPGPNEGSKHRKFTGLEVPPELNPDGQGTAFTLKADKLGSISIGTPIFYRDLTVGEVLGTDMGDGFGPISIRILIRSPYDAFVKPNSRFWNASGFTVAAGEGGFHVEMQSFQAVLQGGISFMTPPASKETTEADADSTFTLYGSRTLAEAVDPVKPLNYVAYVRTAVKDLAPNSPVQIFGITVGSVTDVKLNFDGKQDQAKVRIAFNVQPDKAFGASDPDQAQKIATQLVQSGMRVRMESSDLVLGHEILSLEFVPGAGQADVANENGAFVLPAEAGGMDHLTDALGDIAGKLNAIPFDQIGQHLSHLASSADQMLTGPEMQQTIKSLSTTMNNVQQISQDATTNLKPALQRLPEISQQLQDTVTHANALLANLDTAYGGNSEFEQNATRALSEVNDAARSIRLLTDYLERHPEALIQGKSGDKSGERSK